MVRLMRFTRFTIIGDDVKPGTNVYTATDTFHRQAQLFLPDELNFAEYTSIRLLYTSISNCLVLARDLYTGE